MVLTLPNGSETVTIRITVRDDDKPAPDSVVEMEI
jgi:hypothetical protein